MKNVNFVNFLRKGDCLLIGAMALLVTGCIPEKGKDMTTVEKVALYYLKDNAPAEEQGNINAYFDFSDGMNAAYENDTTKEILKSLVNKVSGEQGAKVFSMQDDKITELPQKTTDLFNAIVSPSSYTKQFAPIEKTLDEIVKKNNNALLVTDFEEYTPDGRIQTAAFASKYFTEWLKRGGDITFYITNYKENQLGKHLYYIVFNKKDQILLSKVKDALENHPVNYQTYRLSTNPCTTFTEYPGAAYGGNYMDNQGNDAVSNTIIEGDDGETYYNYNLGGAVPILKESRYFKNGVPVLNAEFYPFGCSWTDIVENAKAMSDPGVTPKFTHLLRHLFVDLSNTDSYTVESMNVIATDIEEDLDKYTEHIKALYCKPKMIDDGQGGLVADLEGDAGEYYDEKGQLLPDYQYDINHPEPTPQIMDLFVLDQTLFNNTKASNPKKVEIGIKLADGASGQIQGYDPGDMIRLDIVIAKCRPNLTRLPSLFAWAGNTNLQDAIVNTLQNLNPEGRVVYSYFLKTED